MGLTAIWGTTEEKTSEVKVRSSETIQTKKKNVIVLELLWGRCPCCPPYPPPARGLTLCHRARRQFLRRVVCCHARYSSTRARACRS